uniref:Major facilitator superfamily (MFS) profile domain-containing protein n=1 Tax=Fusarium oxysporum (strain Fo5176) TaxID=660025 RepID=A0A0D2Y505_FUSOF
MDARVTEKDTRTQDDGKPETISGSQTERSLPVSDRDETEVHVIPPARFWGLCVGVLLGLFLSMIDTSIVATSLHSIGVDFEVLEDVNWVALAYTLAYLGCAIVFARISDIVGRRDAFIAAYIIFFIFSIACGFARSINQLIAFRALQGIGGSDSMKQHIAALIFIQHRWHDRFASAFPINIFRNRIYSTAIVNTLLNGFPYLLLIYAIPLRFQVVSGKSALISGVMLLPMLGTAAIGSLLAGKINATKNYTFESLVLGSSVMTIGCGLLTSLSHEPNDAKLLGYMTFCGLGFGLTVASSTMLSTVEVPIRDYAPAQGILSQVRLLGGSLGIAASSALLNEKSSNGQLSAIPTLMHFR